MTLPDPARSRVVLIGASRFTDRELPDLPAVRNNLDESAVCLRGIGRCMVVADPESPVALVDPVHDAAAEAEDTLIVYYAGHGLVHPRTLGSPDRDSGDRQGRRSPSNPLCRKDFRYAWTTFCDAPHPDLAERFQTADEFMRALMM